MLLYPKEVTAMKAERRFTMLWAAVLAFLISFGSVGCLRTGMRMECQSLLLCCAAGSIFWVLCLRFRLTVGALCACALAGGYLWRKGILDLSTEALIANVSTLYDQGYGWGILRWSDADLTTADPALALCVVALAVSLAVAAAVMRRQTLWVSAAAGIAPFAVCLVLTDTVPLESYLYLLLLGFLLLLLTQGARRKNAAQGNTLCAMVLIPVALALLCLFYLVPQKGYTGQEYAQKLEDVLSDLFTDDSAGSQGNTPAVGDVDNIYSLRNAGPRTDRSSLVMKVKAQETATLYLRGCSYDYYDGLHWEAKQGAGSWDMDFHGIGEEKQLTIATQQPHSVLYFTYAPEELPRMAVDGRIKNVDKVTEYKVSYRTPVAYNQVWDGVSTPISDESISQCYLQLPDSTRIAATELLKNKVGFPTPTQNAGQVWKNANIIADFVRSRGKYDIETEEMPLGEADFAMWFLQDADTGYCVHYASATVVLLRAAGIPARYVSGYLVNARAGQNTQVRLRQAHAWAECYINGYGWVVLESTPSGSGSPVPEQDAQETQTQPTEETTEPTEETATTQPQTQTPTHEVQTTPDGAQQTPIGEFDITPLLTALAVTLVFAAVIVQWQMRVHARRRRQRRGRINARVLACWQEAALLARLLGQQPNEELLSLAQEAKYSLHTLTPAHLKPFEEYLRGARRQLRKHPVWKQVYYTVILALW